MEEQKLSQQVNPLKLKLLERQLNTPNLMAVPPGTSLIDPSKPGTPLFTSQPRPEKPSTLGQLIAERDSLPMADPRRATYDQAILRATTHAPATTVNVGGRETDKKFAEDYVSFATGGYADTVKQLEQLRSASKILETSPEGTITGPTIGIMPRPALASLNPQAASTLENVEEVVQRNLRLILGAQFTEKEGERLISRSYNPYLPQAENKKRVDRLITQIQSAAEAKLSASKYFQENGTLEGWTGKLWTMQDFNPEKDVAPARRSTDRGRGRVTVDY